MAKKPESRLQKRAQVAIKKEWPYSWGFKVHGGPFQKAGIPDHVFCIEGRFIAIEWKHPDQRSEPSEIQLYTIRFINRAGGLAFVADSIPEAIAEIKRFLRRKTSKD